MPATGYLLDTNVLSELVRKRPSPAVVERLRQLANEDLSTSALCVTELRHGAARHPQGQALWERLQGEILSHVRILPLGTLEAERAGETLAALEAVGTPVAIEDVLIGATALVHDLTVATRNVRHFERIPGLRVESWWEE